MADPRHEQERRRPRRPSEIESERDERTGRGAAAARIANQHSWVDQQVRRAMERGDFDDLPGAGKPIENLGAHHDPDWWVKQLVEREQITGVLPAALQLRKDDAALDARLDALAAEREVRRELEDFNARVIRARYSATDGPPLVTMPRDVETDVAAWRERRTARAAEQRRALDEREAREPTARRGLLRRWRFRAG